MMMRVRVRVSVTLTQADFGEFSNDAHVNIIAKEGKRYFFSEDNV